MALSERTERAVKACFDAVLVPDLWPDALQQLADSLGAASSTFCTQDRSPFKVPISSEHGEFAELWLRNESHAPDPYTTRSAASGRAGSPYSIHSQIITAEEHRTLPYFNETARPGNREWLACACFSVADRQWGLSVYRNRKQGQFTLEEGRYLAGLGAPLRRVVAMAEKFAEVRVAATLSALENLKCAAMVIDGRGVAHHLNRLAEDLLGEDFHLCAGRPAARDPASNRRLQRLLASILAAGRDSVPIHDQVVIERDGSPWLLVDTMPVTALGSDVFSPGRAILTLTDLTAAPLADAALLALVFGLTAAEAKMAVRIGLGNDIDEAARALRISRETARTQLKAVFLKTNTRRQAELVALIGRLRSPIRS